MVSLFQAVKAAIKGQSLRAKKETIQFAPGGRIKFAPAKKIQFAPKPTSKKGLIRRIGEAIKSVFGKIRGVPRQPASTQRTGPAYVSPDLLEEFLHAGKRIVTIDSSTNVQAMQYDADHQVLYIWFHGGGKRDRRYTYGGIGEAKARRFYEAASRGYWTWSEIRWPGHGYLQKTIDPI